MHYKPSISVIMPVYNTGKYVGEAIQSILHQTYNDFELIIIDDGSTDNSTEIIKSFKDKRIKVLHNNSNLGNYPTRNRGFNIAQGKYICVMDADDFALSQRLERQFLFMDDHPEIGLAGSAFRHYGKEHDIFRETNYERIKVLLFRNICFIHPTLIIRYDFLKKNKLIYDEKYYYAADYDLIVRAARCFPVTNIPEVLLSYRLHENQISTKNSREQHLYTTRIVIEQLRFIGINPDEAEIKLHTDFIQGKNIGYNKKQLLYEWINKILVSNQKAKYYDQNELESFFDALLTLQSYCKRAEIDCNIPVVRTQMKKADLSDTTFLIPLRVDSQERIENINTVISNLQIHFKTNIIVLEADSTQNYYPEYEFEGFKYSFIKDNNEIFHKAKWISRLMSFAVTPFVAVWDADAICPPNQVISAVNLLRAGKCIMSFPFDGRYYSCDKTTSDLFKRVPDIRILHKRLPAMQLMRGYHFTGGAFMVNIQEYMKAGGENENMGGSKFVDDERVKRIETRNLPIKYFEGPLFHLWHPECRENEYNFNKIEIHSLKVFLKTCKS